MRTNAENLEPVGEAARADGGLTIIPMSIKAANAFVREHHRHNKPVLSALFAIGLGVEGRGLVGVAIVGRPVARLLQDGWTAEVVRACVLPDTPNANSKIYAACWRAWRAMGGRRLVTYTLQTESGASLRAAGWRVVGQVTPSNGWNREKSGRLREWQSIYAQPKFRWETCG